MLKGLLKYLRKYKAKYLTTPIMPIGEFKELITQAIAQVKYDELTKNSVNIHHEK